MSSVIDLPLCVCVWAHTRLSVLVCISSMFAHLNANVKWDDGLTLACRKMTINFNIICLLNDCRSGPCRFFFSSPLYHSGILFSFSVLKRTGQQTKKVSLGSCGARSRLYTFFHCCCSYTLSFMFFFRKREGEVLFFVLDFFCMTSVGKREFRPIVTHIRRNDNDKGKTFFFFFYFSWSSKKTT